MKRKLFPFVLLLCLGWIFSLNTSAQTIRKPLQLVREELQKNAVFAPLTIQSSTTAKNQFGSLIAGQVREYNLFSFSRDKDMQLLRGANLELTLPDAAGPVTLQLVPVNIYAGGFSAVTSSGERLTPTGLFYQGIVKGDEKSLAAISIFNDEIAGFISSSRGNYVVGKLRNTGNGQPVNILYRENQLQAKPNINCSTPDIALPVPPAQTETSLTSRCVRIYYETEVDFYNAFGNNATSVTNYVTNLFNQNKTLYENDGISVSLSQIFVWNTADPYNGTSSGTLLGEFQSVRTSFNGDAGQLITTRNIGGGQAAVIYGLCGPVANRLCVSGDLTTSFPNVPAYSWEVMVTTHELGHLLGSRHTHACVWNGNNTAIDGCAGGTEGGCALPGIPAGGGTIMSYCHLQSVGINFSNGFGPQPAAQIRNSVEASACLTGCAQATCCGPLTGLAAVNITTGSATLSWNSLSGATSYQVDYRQAGSSTWIALGTTAATSIGLSGLTQATQYEWRVKANCNEAASYYATSVFATGAPCVAPGGLAASNISSNSATVSWAAAAGATSYVVEYRVAGAATWTVLAATTATSVNLTGLTAATNYEWRVKTNCGASVSGYASSAFTTLAAPPCGTPVGLFADVDNCNGVAYLSWDPVPGATSYIIERKFSTSTIWTVLDAAWPNNSYEAYGFGTYNWRVKATCPNGAGEYSAVFTYICRFNRFCDPIINQKVSMKLNPQPAQNQLNISFNWDKQTKGSITIRNKYGVSLLQLQTQVRAGENTIKVNISSLKPGTYFIYLQADGRLVPQRLVVGNQ